MTKPMPRPAFRPIPFMGVIYVVAEAMKLGFRNGHPDWSNLGQGQPEVGPLPGAPPRLSEIAIEPQDHAYGPVNGIDEFREAVAAHYNRLFRQGKRSQYTKENVAVASGGRLMLSRLFAALGPVNVGYQIPDYTAYEDLFDYHRHRVTPVLLPTSEATGFAVSADLLAATIRSQGLNAFVFSNPCNPTGHVVQGEELASYVAASRSLGCTIAFDEFYSHFIYTEDGKPGDGPVSAAAFVEDVDRDPVVIVDGLTKSFRYPGWRLGWALGPREMIDALGRASSAIDGGPSTIVQRAGLAVLEPARADQETAAVRAAFARKRNLMLERLTAMGLRCPIPPTGTFYVWANIDGLAPPFNDAEHFFRAALERRVMTVPGAFFDVNPGKARGLPSPLASWMRFSFGPPEANVAAGVDRLAAMLAGR